MADARSSHRVLIVDDTPEIRRLLRINFEHEPDFTVVGEAGDGAAAIELARAHAPELVVLDLAMPVMDGLQAIPEIRRCSPETKILVFSGFASGSVADEVRDLGAHAYLEKGAHPREILSKLASLFPQLAA